MITIGVDLGSAAIKAVFAERGNMIWSKTLSSTSLYVESCERLYAEGLADLGLKEQDIGGIAATGYGKSLFRRSGKVVNEISANALGAFTLSNGVARTIINIGGQDVKIIKLGQDGRVSDFKMNDKCAAGTGRFFEMAERILGIPLDDFGMRSNLSRSPVDINSTCTVFAETELISLMSRGKDQNDIIAGLNKAIAKRIAALADSLDLEDEIFFDGGPALNSGLHQSLQEEFQCEISVLDNPQFTVAFGAAMQIAIDKGYTPLSG